MSQDHTFDEDEIRGVSDEMYASLFSSKADEDVEDDDDDDDDDDDSSNLKWKDIEPLNDGVSINLTMGITQEDSWAQAQTEISDVLKMLKVRVKKKTVSLADTIDLIYGKAGRVYAAFKNRLRWNYSFFRKFIATLAFQHALNLSTKTLYDDDAGRISKDGLMTKEEYTKAWETIGKCGMPKKDNAPNSAAVGSKYFWQEVQCAFNETYRELFVYETSPNDDYSDSSSKISTDDIRHHCNKFVIDDFKMYFVTLIKEKAGLRITQHTRANRRGPVMHQLVRTASGIIVGFYFERESESEAIATTNLLSSQLFPSKSSEISELDLDGIEIAGDRAYNRKQVTRSLVASGADINGTKAMTLDCPFVFGKKLKDGDKRTELDKEGAKTLWIKKAKIEKRAVYIHAYRNGNGGIVLGITTKFPNFEWELVVKNPKDISWYDSAVVKLYTENERPKRDDLKAVYKRCFQPVFPKKSQPDVLLNGLLDDAVLEPLTTTQRTAEWFFLRSFSCTSRTVHGMLNTLWQATDKEIVAWLDKTKLSRDSYNKVARFFKKPEAPTQRIDSDTESGSDDPEELGEERDNANKGVDEKLVFGSNAQSIKAVSTYLNNLEKYRKSLHAIGKEIGMKPKSSDNILRNWLSSAYQIRRAYFQIEQMKPTYHSIDAEFKRIEGNKITIREIRSALNKYYGKYPEDTNIIPCKERKRKDELPSLSLDLRLTKALLDSTYMRKIEGRAKVFTDVGNRYEEPLVKKMFKDLGKNNKHLPNMYLDEIYHAPLTGLRSNNSDEFAKCRQFMQKCSADFLCGGKTKDDDGEHIDVAMGVEVKTRSSMNTRKCEQEKQWYANLIKKSQNNNYSRNQERQKYHVLQSSDPVVHKFIPDNAELVQMLQCATIYDYSNWMLLIGSGSTGDVIAGIIIDFAEELTNAWHQLAMAMGGTAIEPLFHERFDELKDVIKAVKPSKCSTLDMHSLKQYWYLYSTATRSMATPLPPCVRLIPKLFSYWNNNKSGSDTRSKLVSHAEYDPPTKSIQGNVVGLMLADGCVTIHRLMQIATAKTSLSSAYPSLEHFRNACNRRLSFKKTLLKISNDCSTPVRAKKAPADNPSLTPAEDRTITRNNTMENGVLTVGEDEIGDTPMYLAAEKYKGIVTKSQDERTKTEKQLLVRKQKCKGPAHHVKKKTGGTCACCGRRNTHVYCFGCHSYYHTGTPICEEKPYVHVKHPGGKNQECILDCYSWSHPATLGLESISDIVGELDTITMTHNKNKNTSRKRNSHEASSNRMEIISEDTEVTDAVNNKIISITPHESIDNGSGTDDSITPEDDRKMPARKTSLEEDSTLLETNVGRWTSQVQAPKKRKRKKSYARSIRSKKSR